MNTSLFRLLRSMFENPPVNKIFRVLIENWSWKNIIAMRIYEEKKGKQAKMIQHRHGCMLISSYACPCICWNSVLII